MFYKDVASSAVRPLPHRDRLRAERVLELGIWDGGSVVFWTEALGLERYAAIDLQLRGDSEYFAAWQRERGGGRVSTHWGVSQTDGEQLARIIARARAGTPRPGDRRLLAPVRADPGELRAAPPAIRPGGWYVIEDWAWDLQDPFQDKQHPGACIHALHPLVLEIARVIPSRPDLVRSLRVYPDFVAIERGPGDAQGFTLSGSIARRPRPWGRIAYLKARHTAGRATPSG